MSGGGNATGLVHLGDARCGSAVRRPADMTTNLPRSGRLLLRFIACALALVAFAGVAHAERYRLNLVTMTINDEYDRTDYGREPAGPSGVGSVVDVTRDGDTITLAGKPYTRRPLNASDAMVGADAVAIERPAPFADADLIRSSFDAGALANQDVWVASVATGRLEFLAGAENGRFIIAVDYTYVSYHTFVFRVYEALGTAIDLDAGLDFSDLDDPDTPDPDTPDPDALDFSNLADPDEADPDALDFSDLADPDASDLGLTSEQQARMLDTDHGRWAACALGLGCGESGFDAEMAQVLLDQTRAEIEADVQRRYGDQP